MPGGYGSHALARLVATYLALRDADDPRRRGRQFDALIADLFTLAKFEVVLNAGGALPRQTDLIATYGNDRYLVEAKWRARRSDVDHVDALRSRLARTASGTIGVLVSMAGFTDGAVGAVGDRRNQPVLLLGQPEVEAVLESPDELLPLLQRKASDLAVNGRVQLAPTRVRPLQALGLGSLESHTYRLANHGRKDDGWITVEGDSSSLVFAQNIPDIDWAWDYDTAAVSLELAPELDDSNDLQLLLDRLQRQGWTTGHGRWSIDQIDQSWHGIGVDKADAALHGWRDRYESASRIHHTEEFTYFDHCDGGFYLLTAQVAATADRGVRHARLALSLDGMPLDTTPLRALAEAVRVEVAPVMRPRIDRRLARGRLQDELGVRIKAQGEVVAGARQEGDNEWTVGIVAENPYRGRPYRPDEPPWMGYLRDLDLIVCALRHHHPHGGDSDRDYRLDAWEFAAAGGAAVLRLVADW